MTVFTFMPGVRVLGTQPCRAKPAGPPISIAHCSACPWSLLTVIRIQLCGLVHWNSLMVPSRVLVFSASNIAKEWCAIAGMAVMATAIPAKPSARNVIGVSRYFVQIRILRGFRGGFQPLVAFSSKYFDAAWGTHLAGARVPRRQAPKILLSRRM